MERQATRIIFAGGGTGGHLYPALAVADELRRRTISRDIVFIGGNRGIEVRLVPQAGYPLRTLSMAGIKGRGVVGRVGAGCLAGVAVVRCLGWMVRRRPAIVIGVGGYASGPAVLAASWLGIPIMLMEQNHYPGATNRFLARRAARVCVPSEAARTRLGGVGTVTGNPVRAEFFAVAEIREKAQPALLVFGGSRGAHSINLAMRRVIAELATLPDPPFIVHQTGEADLETVREFYHDYDSQRVEVLPFLDDMPQRLSAADLVICRAGAMTLAELAASGKPAILIPYPHAADDHQRHNAQAVADVGAAVVVTDNPLDVDELSQQLKSLLNDRTRMEQMGTAARQLARPDATERIVDIAESLIGEARSAAHVS